MLTRKPRVGETLTYAPPTRDVRVGDRYRVTSVDGNICHTLDLTFNRASQFIWRFHDGLNRYFGHLESEPCGA